MIVRQHTTVQEGLSNSLHQPQIDNLKIDAALLGCQATCMSIRRTLEFKKLTSSIDLEIKKQQHQGATPSFLSIYNNEMSQRRVTNVVCLSQWRALTTPINSSTVALPTLH